MRYCQVAVWGQHLVAHLVLLVFCGHRHLLSIWVSKPSLVLPHLCELLPTRCTSSLLLLVYSSSAGHQVVNLLLSGFHDELYGDFLAGSLLRRPFLLVFLGLLIGTLQKTSATSFRVDAVASKDATSEVDTSYHYGHAIALKQLI